MVSTPFFHTHCFHITKAVLTSSITLMPERIKSPSCSSALPSPLHPCVKQPLPCVGPVQEEFLTGHLHLHLAIFCGHFLQGEEALVSWRIWPRAQWSLFKSHPVEGTVWFSQNQKCPANSVCPMLKGGRKEAKDSKGSHPDRSDEGNIYLMISDLNIISASAASCKLFCNLPDNV